MEKTLATPDNTRSVSVLCSAAVKTRSGGFERRTKRRLSQTKASVRVSGEEDEEEEKEEVKEKIEALKRIIPGGTALGVDELFEETAGYIMSLQCQIKSIKVLTSFLQRLDKQDMKFGG
ncbi:Transcription factor PAR1 [Raphanus sativus]|uniref:Transcription factor PAR1 n=1 Tax=Raphanus sativus TaxID=3726 RepID=A0A6J0MSP5_RAPSA|nr:transcription factor PAR1 [Raphanus sativus]KAJ4906571.1 Transcription factor PAR1 [Raphanus sativus]